MSSNTFQFIAARVWLVGLVAAISLLVAKLYGSDVQFKYVWLPLIAAFVLNIVLSIFTNNREENKTLVR